MAEEVRVALQVDGRCIGQGTGDGADACGIPAGAIWVRLPRFIGDAVLISQTLEPLRRAGYPLVAWGGPAVCELFRGSNAFTCTAPDELTRPSIRSMVGLLRRHKAGGVISLARSHRALVVALLAGVRNRIGWSDGVGWLLCRSSVSFRRTSGHQVERYGVLLKKAFPGLADVQPSAFVPRQESCDRASALLAGLVGPFVAAGVGARSDNKRVDASLWIAIGKALKARNWPLVLLGAGNEDLECARRIQEELPESLNLVDQTPLSVLAGVLKRSAGAIGGDSAMCHLAGACAVPTVVVFGPTDPGFSAPPQPWVQVESAKHLPCVPCRTYPCALGGYPCMKELDPEDILKALDRGFDKLAQFRQG